MPLLSRLSSLTRRLVVGACVVITVGIPLLAEDTKKLEKAEEPKPWPILKPLPQAAGAFLEKDYTEQECQWTRRCLLAPALPLWQGQSWAQEAETLAAEALDCLIQGELPSGKKLADLAPALKKLLPLTGEDSLLTFLTAKALFFSEGWRVSMPLTKKLLERVNLNGALEMYVIEQRHLELNYDDADRAALDQRMAEALTRALNDNSYDAKADAVLVRHQIRRLGEKRGLDRQADIERWQGELERSDWPEWVKLTLAGKSEIALAWIERTNKWAKDVTPRQWQAFRDRLNVAFETLRRCHILRPDRPEAAAEMITVTMGLGRSFEQDWEWFEKAITAQFDYKPAYQKIIWCAQPRWRGSYELMLAFGIACAETGRFDTEVPRQLMIVAMDVTREIHEPRVVFREPKVKAAIAAMVRGYLQETALSPSERKYLLSDAALCAWLADEDQLAHEALQIVGPDLHWVTVSWLHQVNRHESMMRAEVAESVGTYGEPLRAAMNPASGTKRADIAKNLNALDEKTLKPEALEYLREARDCLAFPDAFAAGDWVSIHPRQHLCAFYQTDGGWSVDKDGTLVAHGTDQESAIVWRLPVGGDVEVRGEFELEVPEKVHWAGQGCGVGAILNWNMSTGPGMYYMFYRASWGVTTARAFYKKFTQGPPVRFVTFKPVNSFHVRMAQGQISYDLNGEPMCSTWTVPAKVKPHFDGCFGLVVDMLPQGARVKFKNISVRKCDTSKLLEVSTMPAPEPSQAGGVVRELDQRSSELMSNLPASLLDIAKKLNRVSAHLILVGWVLLGLGGLTILTSLGLGLAERRSARMNG